MLLNFYACTNPQIRNESPLINEVKSGTHFMVNLPEDHNTGFTWQLNDNYDNKILQNENAVWHGNRKGIYFNFKALSVGQTTLTFINRKYTDTLDVKSFIVKNIP